MKMFINRESLTVKNFIENFRYGLQSQKLILLVNILVISGIIGILLIVRKLFWILYLSLFMSLILIIGSYLIFVFRERINWGTAKIYEWMVVGFMLVISYFLGERLGE